MQKLEEEGKIFGLKNKLVKKTIFFFCWAESRMAKENRDLRNVIFSICVTRIFVYFYLYHFIPKKKKKVLKISKEFLRNRTSPPWIYVKLEGANQTMERSTFDFSDFVITLKINFCLFKTSKHFFMSLHCP